MRRASVPGRDAPSFAGRPAPAEIASRSLAWPGPGGLVAASGHRRSDGSRAPRARAGPTVRTRRAAVPSAPVRAARTRAQRDHLGGGPQRVADPRRPAQHEALDRRGLAITRWVARVARPIATSHTSPDARKRTVDAHHRPTQVRVERELEPIPRIRLVDRRVAVGEREAGAASKHAAPTSSSFFRRRPRDLDRRVERATANGSTVRSRAGEGASAARRTGSSTIDPSRAPPPRPVLGPAPERASTASA